MQIKRYFFTENTLENKMILIYGSGMPQMQLPIFPSTVTPITNEVAFIKKDGKITYVMGSLPVFTHNEEDVTAFRIFASQLVVNGVASQSDIVKSFGIPKVTVKRFVKRFREQGIQGFFKTNRGKRGGTVLTPDILVQAQELLNEGKELKEIGSTFGIRTNTLNKAVQSKRLHRVTASKEKKTKNMVTRI
jgi:transposase